MTSDVLGGVFVVPADQHRYGTAENVPSEFEHLISADTQLDAGEILLQHDRIPQVPLVHGQSLLWTAPQYRHLQW